MIQPNSEIIKTSLMAYFRYKRQWICATEVLVGIIGETADVMVDTGQDIREIEIKCSKQDLWQGEKRKRKHHWYAKDNRDKGVNSFYICVPTKLLIEAEKWVKETNSKYGIIEFSTNYLQQPHFRFEEALNFIKRAKSISSVYSKDLKEKIVYRMCSELIVEKENRLKDYITKVKVNNAQI